MSKNIGEDGYELVMVIFNKTLKHHNVLLKKKMKRKRTISGSSCAQKREPRHTRKTKKRTLVEISQQHQQIKTTEVESVKTIIKKNIMRQATIK